MDDVSEATLERGIGLRGNAEQGGRRQVTIISKETWDRVCSFLDADLSPSRRRANLLISGIDLTSTRGKVLAVGPCKLRIEGETRPCYRMDEAFHGLQEALRGDWGGGVYCTIIRGGCIGVGDSVMFLQDVPAIQPNEPDF
jgi:MOSC domain-containing protein YiiM